MERAYTKVELETVTLSDLPGDVEVRIRGLKSNGQIGEGCRSLKEFDEVVKDLIVELRDLRREATKHLR